MSQRLVEVIGVLMGRLAEEEVEGKIVQAFECGVVVAGLVWAREARMAGPVAHEPIEIPKALGNPLRNVGAGLSGPRLAPIQRIAAQGLRAIEPSDLNLPAADPADTTPPSWPDPDDGIS